MAQNFEISLELAAEDVADEMQLDSILKKKKGRGFGAQVREGESILKTQGYETLEEQGVGNAQKSIEGWIILVTGVHEEASEEDLLERFSEYGPIKNLHLNLDRRTGFVKGYALIEYESLDEAKAAIAGSNETKLLGQTIYTDFTFIRGNTASTSTLKVTKYVAHQSFI